MDIKSLIIEVKAKIGELLTPSEELLTISMAEQPIDTYIRKSLYENTQSFLNTIHPGFISPLSGKYAKVSYNAKGLTIGCGALILPSEYSTVTVNNYSGNGTIEKITVSSITTATPTYMYGLTYSEDLTTDNEIYKMSAAGELVVSQKTQDRTAVLIGDLFIVKNEELVYIGNSSNLTISNGTILLLFKASGADAYFKSVKLSNEEVIYNIFDGRVSGDTITSCQYSNFTESEFIVSSKIKLPYDMISIHTMKYASWSSISPRVTQHGSDLAELQLNQYTRSGIGKPVIVVEKEFSGDYLLSVYSKKDEQDTLQTFTYIPNYIPQLIQDNLITAYSWLCAHSYLVSIGNRLSETATQMYQQKLKEILS